MIFYIIQHYLIMFVQSYSPPIPTSITAKSTCVHKSVTENSFRLNVGVCVCWGCGMYDVCECSSPALAGRHGRPAESGTGNRRAFCLHRHPFNSLKSNYTFLNDNINATDRTQQPATSPLNFQQNFNLISKHYQKNWQI